MRNTLTGTADVKIVPGVIKFESDKELEKMKVHFTTYVRRVKRDFYVSNEFNLFDTLYNRKFYVPITDLNSDIIERMVKSFNDLGFVNAIPVFDESTLNRGKTMIAIDTIVGLGNVINKFEEAIKNNSEKVNKVNKFILEEFVEILKEIQKADPDFINNNVLFIEVRNTIFNLHGIELKFNNKTLAYPIINSYQISEFLQGEDIKLNFSEKGKGIYSASLNPEMFTVNNFLFRPVVGSFIRLDKNGLSASYMGSVFTEEMFENYTKLRILVEMNFKPAYGDSMFNSQEKFDNFNEFINHCKNVKSIEYLKKNIDLPVSFDNMSILIEGEDAGKFDRRKIGEIILKSILETCISNDVDSNPDYVREKLKNTIKEGFIINEGSSKKDKVIFKKSESNDLNFDIRGW